MYYEQPYLLPPTPLLHYHLLLSPATILSTTTTQITRHYGTYQSHSADHNKWLKWLINKEILGGAQKHARAAV